METNRHGDYEPGDWAINPYRGEAVYTKEELRAEILKELESLERKKAHLLELLATVDPAEKRRQDYIDEFYFG